MSRLEEALQGHWLEWDGLPPGLNEQALLQALGPGVIYGEREPALLAHQMVQRREYFRQTLPTTVRAWFTGDTIMLVELEMPPSDLPVDALLAAWKHADRSGAGRRPVFGAMTTEYVYLARGISLTIAESYEDPPAFEPYLAFVQLFVPTDLQGFIVDLGGNDQMGPRSLIGPSP